MSTFASVFAPLETARTRLVLPALEDAPRLIRYYKENKEHLAQWESVRAEEFYTEAFWLSEISRIRDEFVSGQSLRLLIVDKPDPGETIIGLCNLRNIIRGAFHGCYLGYSLHHQAEGKGLMFEALTAFLAYAFNDMGLHRVMANYMPTNERSARLLRRLGFEVEGYARDYLFLAGKWQDHVLTSLINPSSVAQQVNENQ
jgi:ribosomal-protein-alanine N-acetyltransferase